MMNELSVVSNIPNCHTSNLVDKVACNFPYLHVKLREKVHMGNNLFELKPETRCAFLYPVRENGWIGISVFTSAAPNESEPEKCLAVDTD